jgi:GTPase SAR1 family protein
MQTARRFLILDYLSSKLSNDVSIEILWRNAIVCYDQSSSPYVQTCLINAYLDSIKAGLAFEIIDGDNFYLPHRFLAKTFTSFNEKNQHRILILSILGPRQSGKSTLLQYMFGIRINKRSTRGLYGSFVKSNVDAYDYILVLDTERLDQGDDEYDRRLTLFCMSVSHIIILNVSNEIPDRFLNMLAICDDSLKRLVGTHCQSSIVHLVSNQIPLFNTINPTINSTKILNQFREHSLLNSNMNITQDTIHFLPLAFRKDLLSSRISTEPIFSECAQELTMKIFHSSRLTSTILSKWLNTAILFFDVLQETPTVSCFHDLTERYYDDFILEYIRRRLFETLTPEHRQQVLGYVTDKSSDEIDQIFQTNILASQESLQSQIDTRLDMIRATKTVRERSKHFLQRQVNEVFDGWRQEATAEANHRRIIEQKDSPKQKSNIKERGTKK